MTHCQGSTVLKQICSSLLSWLSCVCSWAKNPCPPSRFGYESQISKRELIAPAFSVPLLCWLVAGVGTSLISSVHTEVLCTQWFSLSPHFCLTALPKYLGICNIKKKKRRIKSQIALKVLWDQVVYAGSVCCLPPFCDTYVVPSTSSPLHTFCPLSSQLNLLYLSRKES